jgi:putative RecB family exonuclease
MIGMPEPTPDELIAEFSEAWHRETNSDVPLLLDDGENEEQLTNKGAAMLEVFHKEVQRPVTVLGVEQEFIMELQDPETGEVLPPLVGRLDALVEASDGNIVVLEHKTSSKRYSETKLRLDLQATTYSLATHTMGLEASVVFQVLLKTTKPAFEVYSVERTPLDYKYLMHTISGVLRAINANAFPPIRDWWCNGCQYALACLNR